MVPSCGGSEVVPSCGGTVVRWYGGTVVQWYSGTVVRWYSGRERTGTCMADRSYLQANLKTSRLAGCLTSVGVMGEIVQLLLGGSELIGIMHQQR